MNFATFGLNRPFFGVRFLSVLSLVLLLAGCGGSQVTLLTSVSEDDGNEVIAVLINEGIAATKVAGKDNMVGVSVGQADTAKAVDIMRLRGLP